MLSHLKKAWIAGMFLVGAAYADDVVIYGTTPETTAPAAASASAPLVTVNDKPVDSETVTLPPVPDLPPKPASNYPWRKRIVTTTFWIGQDASSYNGTTNYKSAWDTNWTRSYGGTDNPTERFGFLPKGRFAVTPATLLWGIKFWYQKSLLLIRASFGYSLPIFNNRNQRQQRNK